ncbi:hypothetical protein MPH_02704 [Macrophomina phaseolina MS6]|uniref:Non-haem dioxygenase N-terminal domain-containing protein n=1 Tax=Macrophomina phaseolina (strain MS6) TaxID=1126212 RepID=K2SC58_MACPH|nr:hypothetical protein MPH_02704 [Macrophomina phaseolina MS6]
MRSYEGISYRLVSTNPPRECTPEEIPIIDLDGIFKDDLEARKAVAREMLSAAENSGFFYIKNHRIPEDMVKNTLVMGFSASQSRKSGKYHQMFHLTATMGCVSAAPIRLALQVFLQTAHQPVTLLSLPKDLLKNEHHPKQTRGNPTTSTTNRNSTPSTPPTRPPSPKKSSPTYPPTTPSSGPTSSPPASAPPS